MAVSSDRLKQVLVPVMVLACLLAIPVIVSGAWLAAVHHSSCMSYLQWRVVGIGLALLLLGLLGLLGAWKRSRVMLLFYLGLEGVAILVLFGIAVFALVVAIPGQPRAGDDYAFLTGFSSWFEHKVSDPRLWLDVKNCLQDAGLCSNLGPNQRLSPQQNGCCRPPSNCGYGQNPSNNADCNQWRNDPSQLCYNCISCRAGLVEELRKDWLKVGIIIIIDYVVLLIVYILTWFLFIKGYKLRKT